MTFQKLECFVCRALLIILTTGLLPVVSASEFRLDVDALPKNGILLQSLDFKAPLQWSNLDPKKIAGCELRLDETEIPSQLSIEGDQAYLIARFPKEYISRSQNESLPCMIKLTVSEDASKSAILDEIVTETSAYSITQSIKTQGGLPNRIVFKKTGRILDTHRWQDRLYHADRQMSVADSKDVTLSVLSDGPICRIVRQEIILTDSENARTSTTVVYHWFFFNDPSGLIHITADYFQQEPVEWKERHFLELHITDGSFNEYLDINKPDEKKKFEGTQNTLSAKGAVMLDGRNRIAMFGGDNVTVYDGLKTGFGPYMLGNGHGAWVEWNKTIGHESVWLQLDSEETETDYADFKHKAGARLSIPELDATAKTWIDVARNSMFYAGILAETSGGKKELEAFQIDGKRFFAIQSDNLGMVFEKVSTENDQGFRLVAMVDIPSRKLLTPNEPQSLFTVKLREADKKPEEDKPAFTVRNLTSDTGWKSVDVVFETGEPSSKNGHVPHYKMILSFKGVVGIPDGESVSLRFVIESYLRPSLNRFRVVPWYQDSTIEMYWAGNPVLPESLTLESATLPTIRLASFGKRMKAFYPQASGIVLDRPFNQNRTWRSRYPSGWSTMPWYAVWNDAETKEDRIGLYIAAHDKDATTKEQKFRTNLQAGTIDVSLEYPAENQGRTDATFAPCRIVLESYRGDWFDAAQKYRDWVRREASWYPREKMGPEGRSDTPMWMKELSVWSIASTPPTEMPDVLRKFQKPLGVPTGLHWYNWHQIPFDNDYPHYFPVKDGFKAAVSKIQKDGDLFVMPYINGRLWDTKDRGTEDWLFTKEAFPGVTKKEDGTPYTETYGSKETDGSKVELGVMCPASEIWFDEQRKIIERLTRPSDGKPGDEGDMGAKGVYIDQVAAADPALCFDTSHGHPLGGGVWWILSYRKMFEKIRSELPDGAVLTTECNAEPFIDLFDGYLTWHFQHDGQVPAFAAVYGGSIQMFGRAFGGGPDMMIASRMKLAESFVFGEQLGWIPPHVVTESERYLFFKKVVALRYKFRDYFYKGEMARPPKLSSDMPSVTADWDFSGQPTVVTLGVVQTGAWRKRESDSVILMFANFSDRPQENQLQVDLPEWNFDPAKTTFVRHHSDGSEQKLDQLPDRIRLEAQDAFVLELIAIQ